MPQPSSMLCCISRKHCPSVQEYPCTQYTGEHPTAKWVSMHSVHWKLYNQVGIHAPLLQTLHNEFSSPLDKNQHRCWEDVMLDGCKDFPPHFCKDFPLLSSHRFRTRPKIRTFSFWSKLDQTLDSLLQGNKKEIQFWNGDMKCVRPNCCLLNFFYCSTTIVEDKLTINSGHPIYRGSHRVDQCDTRTIAETDTFYTTHYPPVPCTWQRSTVFLQLQHKRRGVKLLNLILTVYRVRPAMVHVMANNY